MRRESFQPVIRIDDYYLFVGRFVGYKMADLAVKAFTLNKKRLLIVGEGPETRDPQGNSVEKRSISGVGSRR